MARYRETTQTGRGFGPEDERWKNKQQLVQDVLRNAGGMASAARAVVQPMLGDIPAGLSGLGTMMLTGDADKAAENTNAVKRAFEYEPNERGSEYLGALGTGLQKGYETAKKLDPKLEGNIAALRGDWEKFSTKAPGAAALAAGVMGVIEPTHGKGKAVVNTAEEAARIAALRAVRESTPRGPVLVSAVEEAIPKLQARGTAGQYLGALKNMPGIKGEELADLGLHNMDPNEQLTREQLLKVVQDARAPRDVHRLGMDQLSDADIEEKVRSQLGLRLQGAAWNQTSFNELGIDDLMPEGFQHPAEASITGNKGRAEAWAEHIAGDNELFDAGLQHTIGRLENGNARDRDLLEAFMNGDDDATDRVHTMVNNTLRELPNDDELFDAVMDPDGLGDQDWGKVNAQYGSRLSTDQEAQDALVASLRNDPRVTERVSNSIRNDIRSNLGDYSWEGKPAPLHSDMRYYNREDPAGAATYTELLEQTGVPPNQRDPRHYAEPHWTGSTAGKNNDVTMHLRVDDVQTPEGEPALLLNELQSKYAQQVGQKGTTADPLAVLSEQQMLEGLMPRIRASILRGERLDEITGIPDALRNQLDELASYVRDKLDDHGIEELGATATARVNKQLDEMLGEPHADPDRYQITHRGDTIRSVGQGGFDDPVKAQLEADRIQAGVSGGKTGFAGDPRMPPRPGLKSWRLRGLKYALREAADRGANDLYFPTGQMMPRIENWVPDTDIFDEPAMYMGNQNPMDVKDKQAREHLQDMVDDDPDYGDPYNPVMRNYDERLPKEWAPYLKKFGAKIEQGEMLPRTGEVAHKATAQRIRFTPELLAEVLRGQKAYQIAAGASLLPLLLHNEEEQSY